MWVLGRIVRFLGSAMELWFTQHHRNEHEQQVYNLEKDPSKYLRYHLMKDYLDNFQHEKL